MSTKQTITNTWNISNASTRGTYSCRLNHDAAAFQETSHISEHTPRPSESHNTAGTLQSIRVRLVCQYTSFLDLSGIWHGPRTASSTCCSYALLLSAPCHIRKVTDLGDVHAVGTQCMLMDGMTSRLLFRAYILFDLEFAHAIFSSSHGISDDTQLQSFDADGTGAGWRAH